MTNSQCGKVGRTVALTPEQDDALTAMAKSRGQRVSEFMRELIEREMRLHKAVLNIQKIEAK